MGYAAGVVLFEELPPSTDAKKEPGLPLGSSRLEAGSGDGHRRVGRASQASARRPRFHEGPESRNRGTARHAEGAHDGVVRAAAEQGQIGQIRPVEGLDRPEAEGIGSVATAQGQNGSALTAKAFEGPAQLG